MSTLEELVAVGKKLQLTDKDLQAFIATQQEAQREERRLNSEAERLEAERERQAAETTRERECQETETAAHRREFELLEVRLRLKVQDGEKEHQEEGDVIDEEGRRFNRTKATLAKLDVPKFDKFGQ